MGKTVVIESKNAYQAFWSWWNKTEDTNFIHSEGGIYLNFKRSEIMTLQALKRTIREKITISRSVITTQTFLQITIRKGPIIEIIAKTNKLDFDLREYLGN